MQHKYYLLEGKTFSPLITIIHNSSYTHTHIIYLLILFLKWRATHPWWMGVPFLPKARGKLRTSWGMDQQQLPPSWFHFRFNYFNASLGYNLTSHTHTYTYIQEEEIHIIWVQMNTFLHFKRIIYVKRMQIFCTAFFFPHYVLLITNCHVFVSLSL